MEKLIEELEDLARSYENQAQRFEVNGHYANAQEMAGRQFGVSRAIVKIRDYLTSTRMGTTGVYQLLCFYICDDRCDACCHAKHHARARLT